MAHYSNDIVRYLVLQRNPKITEDEPGFPEWSIPFSMNCSCRPPCSFITYTTELRYEIR